MDFSGLRVKDVSAGLVERFRIASNGRVGIGTIDPDGLLHVQHTSFFWGGEV